ncbi:EIN3-binding F-box protein 1-like [Olea europaea var. sylvestris]|uniref:EIN3-binding F-box 1-like n=1 Tax=Olea europaea subsp. europaea TaxID=158383 RepID=A0A8S0S4H7_OLEEU|nr:EIN3-binding F-box protein 1-like [Olea europaea var. sylvestris]CAA2986300.1 EIN3-binding F-box 1-like [Olea europaea subsp. europaea]
MSKVINFRGDDDIFPWGFLYPNPKESSLFLSRGHHVDVYVPPRKRSRVSAPFFVSREQKQQSTIEVLPDECLFEVFRRLTGGQERSACAGVSKRWLMLLSCIRRDEICNNETTQPVEPESRSNIKKAYESAKPKEKGGFVDSNGIKAEVKEEDLETDVDGYLSKCLEGKKATDVRLAAIAVGTGHCGGLGKLSIRGSSSTHGLTNFGLKAIARGCPSLRELSIWNLSSIGDEGLLEIANGCHLLEKLDLCHCSAVTDKGLLAIAKNCPNLVSVTIESCSNIGNESLKTLGCSCPNLKSITVKNCPLVGDQGIAGLFSSAGNVLTKVKLQALNISDVSLAVIGHYGSAMTDLALIGLQNVNERGFWVMASGQGLQKLKSLAITTCRGVSDLAFEAIGKGCPNLHQICLRRCPLVSDSGLVSFAKSAGSLKSLQLEECRRITQCGVFGFFANCGGNLKALALSNCLEIRNINYVFPSTSLCHSLQSLTIRNCPGFDDASLAMVGRLCPNLTRVDLSGLQGITDAGLLPFVQSSDAGLVKVNLNGCVNLTNIVVATISKLHGSTLEVLNLEGCRFITDASLVAVARDCWLLNELDVSKCGITDSGIAALAGAKHLNLQILSLAGCSLVSDRSAPLLVDMGKTMVGLNLQHCNGISSDAVDLLVEQLGKCDILF